METQQKEKYALYIILACFGIIVLMLIISQWTAKKKHSALQPTNHYASVVLGDADTTLISRRS